MLGNQCHFALLLYYPSLQRLQKHCLSGRRPSKTRKDMALSAISMNSAIVDKEFVLSLYHKLQGLKMQ